jgi:serine-type D-Ala-D-Ala carboxypeptidase (penicillin-binding protein 5/6)
MTGVTMFLVVSLKLLGIQSPFVLNPQSDQPTIAEVIESKLTRKVNTYTLKEDTDFLSLAQKADAEDSTPAIQSNGYVVINYETGEIVDKMNSEAELPIASLTKIMTAVVALDLAQPTDVFTVTPTAAQIVPTKIGVEPGQKLNVNELLQAVLLTSANDAAQVIQDGIDQKYGQDVFIKSMNEKAKFLGLTNTSFSNPQGFDSPSNYSSPEDLAILSHYALTHYPLIAQIVKKDYAYIDKNQHHENYNLPNWNGLIDVYPHVSGIKIGNTEDAGKTTIVISERENKKILVVLLGAPGVLERDMWAIELLNLGFTKAAGLPPIQVTEEQLRAKYQSWYN